ncbi:hypothetical protein BKA64DRAFT_634657 [Cadophora sp. MPI-SDFR-AT-0126]|nr:hypothetical protein BKA64DRAFT_634657 [Leotiomycetes sp. MPI-SDFR-AT-0126]
MTRQPTTTNQKRRGRPLKDPSDASTDLQRARVRRAQKAFRTRKEQHVANLEEKCKTLESVVEAMTNEFIRFSDGLLGVGEMGSGDVDAYVKRELRGTMERFLELGRRAGREPGEEEGDAGGDEQQQQEILSAAKEDVNTGINEVARTYRSDFDLSKPSGGREQESNFFSDSSISILPPSNSAAGFYSQTTAISFPAASFHAPQQNANPYLNNIWTIPPASPSDSSAIPYILAGRDSFAARLYFSMISSAVHSLRGNQPPTLAQSFFRYKCHYVSPIRIQKVVDGVLNMLLHGTSQVRAPTGGVLSFGLGEEEFSGDDDEMRVKRAILSEVEQRGEKEDEFLATWGVERYLRTKWRLAVDSNTVRVKPRAVVSEECVNIVSDFGHMGAVGWEVLESGGGVVMGAPTIIPGFEHISQKIWDAGTLVERLLDVAVTIGEGPRWHYKQIDSVVEAFLVENGSRN